MYISETVFTAGNKDNLPIVFVHGFPYDRNMWENQVQFFKNDYYCVTYDIRGLGKHMVEDGQFTMETLVDDLYELMYELELARPVICGLSMGGYICLRALERNQSAFSGVILCDTKSAADDNEGRIKRAGAIKKINTEGLQKYVLDSVPSTFAGETIENNASLLEAVMQRAEASDPTGVKGCILAMMGRTDTTEFLGQITIPTLLISGSFDKLTPPIVMRQMCEKIKDAEFAIAPRAGHMAPLENPEFVNDVIAGFLKRRVKE